MSEQQRTTSSRRIEYRGMFLKRGFLIVFILISLGIIFILVDRNLLSWNYLTNNYQNFLFLAQQHPFLTLVFYGLAYVGIVTFSVPIGAVFMTLLGGLLFGPFFGTLVVAICATVGASIAFGIVKTTLGHSLEERAKGYMKKIRRGFSDSGNAFSYLLFLRLVPIFPFFGINIAAGLLGIPFKAFFWGTLIGTLPGSFVYASVGNGLDVLLESNQVPNLSIITSPPILFPLIALAGLSVIPIFYRRWKKKRSVQQNAESVIKKRVKRT